MYRYEAAFGAADITSRPMRQAIADWYDLYYRHSADTEADPCQRIAYTVVGKLVRSVFGEYTMTADTPFGRRLAAELGKIKEKALQLALVAGECYLKPCPDPAGFSFTLVDRRHALIFARDASGMPTDMGFAEKSCHNGRYYTLLERRRLAEDGRLVIENKLYRSRNPETLGEQVALNSHPAYASLPGRYLFDRDVGLGLVQLKMPMLNCVDGSSDGVSIYAAAAGLIRNADENEAQLSGEFARGKSRLVVSADLLRDGQLQDSLFVGLDEDPAQVGIHAFSPQLREQSYFGRKQEYLRSIESVIGLKRGMLSDANAEDRTATEISASSGEFNLTVIGLQQVWHRAVAEAMALCQVLSQALDMETEDVGFAIDWGNGTLYDEDKRWAAYVQMVQLGLLKPEIALGWRFDLPAETEEDLAAIRKKLMPAGSGNGQLTMDN